jgi:hypothetical protein
MFAPITKVNEGESITPCPTSTLWPKHEVVVTPGYMPHYNKLVTTTNLTY